MADRKLPDRGVVMAREDPPQSKVLMRTGWVFPMLSVLRDPVWAEMVAGGGNAGCGGDGGNGGNGGVFKLFYTSGVAVAKFTPMMQGGDGGIIGTPGAPGSGGLGLLPGLNILHCSATASSVNGSDGLYCRSQNEGGISKRELTGLTAINSAMKLRLFQKYPASSPETRTKLSPLFLLQNFPPGR